MTPVKPASRAMILMEFTLAFLSFCLCLSVIVLVLARGLTIARDSKAATMASLQAQNIVESIKATDGSNPAIAQYLGDIQADGNYKVEFDGNWQRIETGQGLYWAQVALDRQGALLQIHVSLFRPSQPEDALFTLDAAQYFYGPGEDTP